MKKNNYFLFPNFFIFSVPFREFKVKNTENQTKNTFYSGIRNSKQTENQIINLKILLMKKSFFLFITSISLFFYCKGVYPQESFLYLEKSNKETIHQKVMNAVASQMNNFLREIPDELLVNYGINNRKEIEQIVIGSPYEVYTLTDTIITFTKTFRVPILIHNEYRSLFTVYMNQNEEYEVVDFGAKVLAETLFSKKHLLSNKMLRVYELKTDFIIVVLPNNQLQFSPVRKERTELHNLDYIIRLIINN
jgi:hypothetical protein